MEQEPSAKELSSEWALDVQKTMSRSVLLAVHEHGAATVHRLHEQRIAVLGLELRLQELIALIKFARRFRFLEPLPSPQLLDGTETTEAEWALTDSGRKQITGFSSWGSVYVKSTIAGVLTVVSSLGILAYIKTHRVVVPIEVFVVPVLALLVMRVVYLERLGASDVEVARQWKRYARDCPKGHARIAAHGEPTLCLLGYTVLVTSVSFLGYVSGIFGLVTLVLLLFSFVGILGYAWQLWKVRR